MDIDELVIKLSLDPKGLISGVKIGDAEFKKLRESSKKAADDVESQASRMVQGFSQVTKELLGLGAVILGVGGLKDLAVKTTQAAAATGNFASVFGLNEEMLNKWEGAMRRFGISADTTRNSIGSLAVAIAELKAKGGGPMQEAILALSQMGITNPDLDDINHLLLQINQAFAHPPPGMDKPGMEALIAKVTPGIFPMLRGLQAPDLADLLERSATATKEQMAAAQRITNDWVELALRLERIINRLLPESEGPSKKITGGLGKIAEGDVLGGLRDLDTAVPSPGLGSFATGFNKGVMDRLSDIFSLPSPGGAAPWTQLPFSPMMDHSVPVSPYGGLPYSDALAGIERRGRQSTNQFISPAQSTDDHSLVVNATVNVTASPGADPRTFGGLVATSLKQALPSVIGATR